MRGTSKMAFYRLTIGLDVPTVPICECFLQAEFLDADGKGKEINSRDRTIFVLCDDVNKVPRKGEYFGREEKCFLQILNPDNLDDLGRRVRYTVVDASRKPITNYNCVVREVEKIKLTQWISLLTGGGRTQWIPMLNGKSIKIASRQSFFVRINDREIGEVTYATKIIEIIGSDVRIYGNQIECQGEKIAVSPMQEGEDKKYLLLIKGSRLSVANIRTVDVEEIQINADDEIEVGLCDRKKEKDNVTHGLVRDDKKEESNIKWLYWALGLCLCILATLTLVPIIMFDTTCDKYLNVHLNAQREKAGTNEIVSVGCMGTPSVVTNTLSMQTCYSNTPNQNLPTNVVNTIATSVSTTVGTLTASRGDEGRGASGVTFYLVMAWVLYIASYGAIVYMTFVTFRTLRRSRKLNGNMRPIIEALRNEPDKVRRRAMQKKILDDMIDTYLDRPSSDE